MMSDFSKSKQVCSMIPKRYHAFTLIELLVVISI
ncbi:MAG TPA: hypothetical protein DER01_16035, partial [Phycisphaerales bacterium]|nr:hypothetical protein [Phycisphaerales bacterium]